MKKKDNNKEKSNVTTKLKKIVEQLKSENFRLKNIIDNLPGDVYWKDKKGVWLGLNNQSSEDLREVGSFWKRKDVIGKTDYDLYEKQTADEFRKNDLEVMRQGIESTKEETTLLPSGRKIIQLSTKKPLRDEKNRIVGIIGISSDITYLKDIETQLTLAKDTAEAASRAKSMFLANMSHDLKTPLTGIISTAEFLMHVLQDEDYKMRADDIVQSGIRLLDLMIEIIEISRLEFQNSTSNHVRFGLSNVITEIVQLIKPAVSDKELELEVKVDKRIPDYLIGNRWHLFRVLLNLVSNAIKFTNKGKITIEEKLIKKNKKDVLIQLSVKDTGIGIPKGKESVIFEQFSRLSPSYEGLHKGSGLGLYIVKQFVESMKGHIKVESKEGKGSKFICVFPFKASLDQVNVDKNESVTKNKVGKNHTSTQNQRSIKTAQVKNNTLIEDPIHSSVLLVEDNPIAARAAIANLESLGCSVVHASTGKEAIQFATEKNIDVVFMDLGLPDFNGTVVTTKIRNIEHQKGFRKVPIIALSAHIDEAIKSDCLRVGMTDAFTKPLLLETAKNILELIANQKEKSSEHQDKNTLSSEQNTIEYEIIDLDYGTKVLGMGDKDEALKMLGMLIESFPENETEMEKLYQAKDFSQLEKVVHKLHGGVAYTGAIKLQKALRVLVDTIRSKKFDEVDTLYKNVRASMDEVVIAYKKL